MKDDLPRFAFVVSTSGSVMNQVLDDKLVRDLTHTVVASEECEGIEKARTHGLPVVLFDEGSNESFCEKLSEHLRQERIDYVLSFYTQFYSDSFRSLYQDRIVNFHPSLLPAFKGMDGFGDGLKYHTKIIGTTVELIKDVMDEGKIVMQSSFAANPTMPIERLRHVLFEQQCKTLIQVVNWITERRLMVDGDLVTINAANFDDLEFVPALEAATAKNLNVPFPGTSP